MKSRRFAAKSWMSDPQRMLAILTTTLLALSVPLALYAQQANGSVHCPPQPGDGAQLNGDVDGDGVRDYVFPQLTQKDAAGNSVEVYCLQASNKHAAQFESYYTDKATGKKYFIGGCYFDGGQNTRSKQKFTDGLNKGNWKLLDWDNVDPNSPNDWHFELDPVTKKETKKKTTHKVVLETRDNLWYANSRSDVVAVEVQDATGNPYEITFGGVPLMNDCAVNNCGGASAPNLVVTSNLNRLGQWEMSFTVPSFGGTGTQTDPFTGSPAHIAAGDSLTIAGVSLTKAYVSGAAADPANGGWVVGSFSASEVTFVATQDAEAWPGRPVGGLIFETS
ncbi:MAG TPA: hypothetical protein VLX28_26890 [Thermoanaerobaculia bacterium]|nr:hypothetical protein [Thermoanaerobaculia bacterium]